MSKSQTKKEYSLKITAKDMQNKEYRKYLYPQEIDGITFIDETERKLSESTWFRCLSPERQTLLEKEMRLRAKGMFNKPILHYEDKVNDPAPAIPKAVIIRLSEVLTDVLFKGFFQLIPYIHPNDGALRNAKRKALAMQDIGDLWDKNMYRTLKRLEVLQQRRIIFFTKEGMPKTNAEDAYIDLMELSLYEPSVRSAFFAQEKVLVYINPFVVFAGQYLDAYILPYFINSGWYTVNPYASKIREWIEVNCK